MWDVNEVVWLVGGGKLEGVYGAPGFGVGEEALFSDCGLSVYIQVDFLFIPLLQAIVFASGLFHVSSLVHTV